MSALWAETVAMARHLRAMGFDWPRILARCGASTETKARLRAAVEGDTCLRCTR